MGRLEDYLKWETVNSDGRLPLPKGIVFRHSIGHAERNPN